MTMNAAAEHACEHDTADTQNAVVGFLSSPAAHGGLPVERIDTHASVLFLSGDRAWKLKRAVRYDYLDYSTCDRRRAMCEAEFGIGTRLAPQLYRRVVSVTRETDGSLTIGGRGVPVDWLVEMARFDQEQLLDRMAARGALDISIMPPLAQSIVELHDGAERRTDRGGFAGMAWVIEGNAAAFLSDHTGALNPAVAARVSAGSQAMSARFRARLDGRRDRGLVRRCHGDLHLGNIVQLDGRPTLFDPIEFNDAIACIDVMYDLAFLLMDLTRLQMADHASALLNAYVAATQDLEGLALLPLFMACRAAVRAKTSATAAAVQRDPLGRDAHIHAAAKYLDLADRLLRPEPPVVVAIGGYSGAGKSSLARRLAPHVGATPGAIVVRTDEIRKRMFGVAPLAHLNPAAYSADVSARVYETLIERVRAVIANGGGAIADAVFLQTSHREAIEGVAKAAGVPFVGLWLDAPEDVLIGRIATRARDVSDATADVIRGQRQEPVGTITWRRIDASQTADRVLDESRRAAHRPPDAPA
jgi:aminoglycoside phosphotransferase family enzyme/predicted kinase